MSTAFYDEIHARYGNPGAFVERVNAKLRLHRISRTKLAERMGVAPIRVSDWLNRKVTPDMWSMATMDEALDELIRGE